MTQPETHRKDVEFEGSSLDDLRKWPDPVKTQAGHQIDRIQQGMNPEDWKPFNTVGQGVKEIRIAEKGDQYRVMYVQIIKDTVHVLHCFQKKSQQTSRPDVDLARKRYRQLSNRLKGQKLRSARREHRSLAMSGQRFESVWDAISDSLEQAEHMKVRSQLMMQLSEYVKRELMEKQQLSGKEAGHILGLTQPQVSYLVRGKIDRFSLDRLVEIASRAGFHVTMAMERQSSAA